MKRFFLTPFLDSLAQTDIRTGIEEYRRISLLVQTSGSWSLARFRDMLLSILAKNTVQRQQFLERFNLFFKTAGGKEAAGKISGKQVLDELKRLTGKVDKPDRGQIPFFDKIKNFIRKGRWIIFPLILFAAVAGLVLFFSNPRPHIEVTPQRLDFEASAVGEKVPKTHSIQNTGSKALAIKAITLEGSGKADFGISSTSGMLLPAEGLSLQVFYNAHADTTSAATLIIDSDGSAHPVAIPLAGKVRPPFMNKDTPTLSEPQKTTPAPTPTSEVYRLYRDMPVYDKITIIPEPRAWRSYFITAFIFLAVAGAFFFLAWFYPRSKRKRRMAWDRDASTYYHQETIGGVPAPLLDKELLDYLADAMGYLRTESAGRILDVKASIHSTVEQGGIPQLVYEKLRRLRCLLILEDEDALAAQWNPVAAELAVGM